MEPLIYSQLVRSTDDIDNLGLATDDYSGCICVCVCVEGNGGFVGVSSKPVESNIVSRYIVSGLS